MKRQVAVVAGALYLTGLAAAQTTPDTPPNTYLTIPAVTVPMPQPTPKQEPSGLDAIIRARFPLAMEYREFGAGWRTLDFGKRYYTKGETAWINGIEHLVAYVPAQSEAERDLSELDKKEYIGAVTNNGVPWQPKDRFLLTLVPLRDIINAVSNGETGLRSFDARQNGPYLDAANFFESFNQSLSLIYLSKINQAVQAYSNTYLQVLPDMASAFAAKQALLPFAENAVIFNRPGTDEPFKFNALLSGKKREHLRRRGSLVLAYEARPAADGMRAILQLNGNTRRVDEDTWQKLRRASGLD